MNNISFLHRDIIYLAKKKKNIYVQYRVALWLKIHLLAALTLSDGFPYDFYESILKRRFRSFGAFTYVRLSEGPTTSFQLARGLDFWLDHSKTSPDHQPSTAVCVILFQIKMLGFGFSTRLLTTHGLIYAYSTLFQMQYCDPQPCFHALCRQKCSFSWQPV